MGSRAQQDTGEECIAQASARVLLLSLAWRTGASRDSFGSFQDKPSRSCIVPTPWSFRAHNIITAILSLECVAGAPCNARWMHETGDRRNKLGTKVFFRYLQVSLHAREQLHCGSVPCCRRVLCEHKLLCVPIYCPSQSRDQEKLKSADISRIHLIPGMLINITAPADFVDRARL